MYLSEWYSNCMENLTRSIPCTHNDKFRIIPCVCVSIIDLTN